MFNNGAPAVLQRGVMTRLVLSFARGWEEIRETDFDTQSVAGLIVLRASVCYA